jgi:alanyl-tRNA synthetase
VAFLIADGVLPGNTGRSYVLRRILRRAVYQGRTIGLEKPFFTNVVDRVVDLMGAAYPELQTRRDFILETVAAEEEQFLRTLSGGLTKLGAVMTQVKAAGSDVIPGDEAFKLKDTDGFPLDLTEKIAAEAGMRVDVTGFDVAMNEQRARSRAVVQFKKGADVEVWGELGLAPTQFCGYQQLQSSATIVALVSDSDVKHEAGVGSEVQLVLDVTPFYAESGGQVGDSGVIHTATGQVTVTDTQRPIPGVIVHYGVVSAGVIQRGATATAQVDATRRAHIVRNHTATHLLQRALRDVVGEHAAQAGSLVAPERLRFDFTHNRAVSAEQLHDIEQRVNAWIRADQSVQWEEMPYQSALDRGAIALFGEKYGDRVRLVHATATATWAEAGYASRDSMELCGGTHVGRTGEIGLFRIVAESSVAGGIRRIEAVTGQGAQAWVDAQLATLRDAAGRLGVPVPQIGERVDVLLADLKGRQRELDALKSQATGSQVDDLIASATHKQGVMYVVARVDGLDVAQMRDLGDKIRDRMEQGVVVLASAADDRAQLLVMVTKTVSQHHAGNLVKELAPVVGGKGGGRPDMAQAGGRETANIDAALHQARTLLGL